jgi:hypothetical protein
MVCSVCAGFMEDLKRLRAERTVLGKIAKAVKGRGRRITLKELRALSAQLGPSPTCKKTSNYFNNVIKQISMVVFFLFFGLIVLAHAGGKDLVTNFFDNIIDPFRRISFG